MSSKKSKNVAVIVAHPDDETLWAGGTLLNHPSWQCYIIGLCRKRDADRAPKFNKALKSLKSEGVLGDLDDGPDQNPLKESEVESVILDLLPSKHFDLIISHNPSGEYTRHLRHEETAIAVINLWHEGRISADEYWSFAFEDGNKEYLPRAVKNANLYFDLTNDIWQRKYTIITDVYGFGKESWEARTTPRSESFWQFTNSKYAMYWLKNGGILI